LAVRTGLRPDPRGARRVANIHPALAEHVGEERGALRVVGRIDPADDRGADAVAREVLRDLDARWSGTQDDDALRQLAQARLFAVRPVAGLLEPVELRDLPDRADRDDHV